MHRGRALCWNAVSTGHKGVFISTAGDRWNPVISRQLWEHSLWQHCSVSWWTVLLRYVESNWVQVQHIPFYRFSFICILMQLIGVVVCPLCCSAVSVALAVDGCVMHRGTIGLVGFLLETFRWPGPVCNALPTVTTVSGHFVNDELTSCRT